MDYECDLRRLFRPPIDHLSSTEQLCRFRQRDMVPSHLYRLGLRLFTEKDKVCRRRVTTLEEGDLEIKQVYPGKRYSYANTAHKETSELPKILNIMQARLDICNPIRSYISWLICI